MFSAKWDQYLSLVFGVISFNWYWQPEYDMQNKYINWLFVPWFIIWTLFLSYLGHISHYNTSRANETKATKFSFYMCISTSEWIFFLKSKHVSPQIAAMLPKWNNCRSAYLMPASQTLCPTSKWIFKVAHHLIRMLMTHQNRKFSLNCTHIHVFASKLCVQ